MRIASTLLATAVLFIAGYFVLAQNSPPATRPATQPTAAAPINKFCAVMHADAVDPTVFVMHDGKKIGFCCSDCIDEFRKDPAKFMKDLK